MSKIVTRSGKSIEHVYNCSDLLDQYEQDLQHCSEHDFQMLEHRIEVLTHLINCGIDHTSLSQLNQVH